MCDAPTGADEYAILTAKVGKKGKETFHVMFLLDRNNIVMATMAIYVNLYNVFQTLLMLLLSLGGGGSNRD